MAADINKVVLIGRLTRDAELSYTNSGFALTKFSIAVNRNRKSGDQWVDEANFFDVVIWGKRGEALNQYLTRGKQLAVEGELRQERWEKDGMKRSKVTIEATNIQLIGGRSDKPVSSSDDFRQTQSQPQQSSKSQTFDSYNGGGSFEDDIPF